MKPSDNKDVGIKAFFVNLMSSLLSGICGSLSVPFTAAASYFSNLRAKILFSILAVVSFLVACYSVWKKEKELLIAIEVEKDSIAAQLKEEKDRRPHPALSLGHKPLTNNPALRPGFTITNKGTSAFNIQFSAITTKTLLVQFCSIEYLHNNDTRDAPFVADQNGEALLIVNDAIHQVAELVCMEHKRREVVLPLSIQYQDADGIRYLTEYDISFEVLSSYWRLIFKRQRNVDNSASIPLNPSNPAV